MICSTYINSQCILTNLNNDGLTIIYVVDHSWPTGQTFFIFRNSLLPHRTHSIIGVLRFVRTWVDLELLANYALLFSQIILSSNLLLSLFSQLFLLDYLPCVDQKFLYIDCELDGICSRSASKVVHSCFESLFPGIEMNWAHFGVGRLSKVNVEGLGLINEGASSQCQVNYLFLADLPYSLEDLPAFLWYLWYFLDWSVLSYQFISDLRSPQMLYRPTHTFDIRYSTKFLLTQTNSPASTRLVYTLAVNGSKV